MSKQHILDEIYNDPANPGSFTSEKKLLIEARKQCENINLSDVKNYLKNQVSYTRHGSVPKKYLKRRVFIKEGPNYLLSGDLADFRNLSKKNDNINYLFFLIDCFSRKLWIYPLKNKKASTLANVLDTFLSETNSQNTQKFRLFWCDEGKEFFNSTVKKIFEKHNVKMYHVFNRRFKASICERSIRTIKSKLYKIMTHFNTDRYIDVLNDVVASYNNSKHRGLIGETPNKVHELTEPLDIKVLAEKMYKQKLSNYGSSIKLGKHPLSFSQNSILKVNSYTRLLLNAAENTFVKSYNPIFSEEIFVIDKIRLEIPTLYFLKDLYGEEITGVCYRSELKPTTLPETYLIEGDVLATKTCPKTKKKLSLVKYMGWPDKFTHWIPSENVEKLKPFKNV